MIICDGLNRFASNRRTSAFPKGPSQVFFGPDLADSDVAAVLELARGHRVEKIHDQQRCASIGLDRGSQCRTVSDCIRVCFIRVCFSVLFRCD